MGGSYALIFEHPCRSKSNDMRVPQFDQRVVIAFFLLAVGLIGVLEYTSQRGNEEAVVDVGAEQVGEMTAGIEESSTASAMPTNARSARPSQGAFEVIEKSDGSFPRQPDTYQLALRNYGNNLFQFSGCVAVLPRANPVFTSGSDLMLDNRSPYVQIIFFDDTSVRLAAQSFALVKIPSVADKKVISIHCEALGVTHFNIASMTIYP